MTEIGFPVEPTEDKEIPPVGPYPQSYLLKKTFAMMQARRFNLNIEHVLFYNIEDDGGKGWDHHCGLFRSTGVPRPAWEEFSMFAG